MGGGKRKDIPIHLNRRSVDLSTTADSRLDPTRCYVKIEGTGCPRGKWPIVPAIRIDPVVRQIPAL
jgi:hypothetical protein